LAKPLPNLAAIQLFSLLQWRRQRSKGVRSFRGHKIFQPGHPYALFSSKKGQDLYQLSPSKHRLPKPFHRQNKTNKAVRYGNIFNFFVHTITEAEQYAGLGRAEPGLEPERWMLAKSFDLTRPGVAPPLVC